jgi:PAS domain S-box-containing protein
MHSLLKRQLRKHVGTADSIPAAWADFIEAVNDAYHQADEDRELLERSLDLTSEELVERNERLRDELRRRREAEQQLHVYVQQQTAIARLGQLTLEGASPETMYEEVVSMMVRILDAPYCRLLRRRPSGKALEVRAEVGWGEAPGAVSPKPGSQLRRVLETEDPVVVESFAEDDRVERPPLLAEMGIESGVAVVIEGDQAPWGVLQAHDAAARSFSENDVNFVQSVANVLAQGLQRRRANRLLEESEARFRAVSENAAELIAILDAEGGVEYAYGAVEEMTGFTAAELQRRDDFALIHPEDRHGVLRRLQEARRNPGEIVEAEFRFGHKKGQWRYLSVRGRNLLGQQGVDGILVNVRDVTRRRTFEQKLIEAKERAEEMVQLKNSFLANMSHEIRTPLTAILGFADTLVEEVSGEKEDFAKLIRDGGKRLSDTLNSVLDLARLEANESNLDLDAVPVREAVEDTVALFQSMAERKGLTLTAEVEDDPVARVDRNALRRILSNLLSNAVKFTDEGSVRVRGWAAEEEVYLAVKDTGIGISEEFQDALFDDFTQESTGRDRDYEGTGLGLTITDRLTNLMGGEIRVESEKGEGSVFTVQLPRAELSRPTGAND